MPAHLILHTVQYHAVSSAASASISSETGASLFDMTGPFCSAGSSGAPACPLSTQSSPMRTCALVPVTGRCRGGPEALWSCCGRTMVTLNSTFYLVCGRCAEEGVVLYGEYITNYILSGSSYTPSLIRGQIRYI